ncbi:hypothetical protein GYMLUDRAFT_248080 [Collybiopsis luxurians FD-317 M1]|uniref:Uncharacterized protein n=1 Tax=Collybiopsis luxurians FD-317 M1 TaxID=944289 RepID=A0A0D0CLQ8_9AGAR|nr:hypothetical protein GYMLUDRAFT_248080 [Collybiopsis luxurians FD-317 M1]
MAVAENMVIGPLMQALMEMGNPATAELREQRRQDFIPLANQSDHPLLASTPLSPLSSDTYLQSDTELAPLPEEAFVQHLSRSFQDYLLNGILPDDASDSDISADNESANAFHPDDSDQNTGRSLVLFKVWNLIST